MSNDAIRSPSTPTKPPLPNLLLPSPEKLEDPKPPSVQALAWGAVLTISIASGIGYLVFWFILQNFTQDTFEAAKTSVSLIGIPTAAGGVYVALRGLRVRERQLHTDQRRLADAKDAYSLALNSEIHRRMVDEEKEATRRAEDHAGQLRSRFVLAADQTGHSSPAVRLAGVIELGRLSQDWESQRQACIDLLCLYLRVPPAKDKQGKDDLAEALVRSTVQQILIDGFSANKSDDKGWGNLNLDLSGAVLVDWGGVLLRAKSARFNGTQFYGSTDFNWCSFDFVTFSNATFHDISTFQNMNFETGNFFNAKFNDRVGFGSITFGHGAFFSEVQFAGLLTMEDISFKKDVITFYECDFADIPHVDTGKASTCRMYKCSIAGKKIGDFKSQLNIAESHDRETDSYHHFWDPYS